MRLATLLLALAAAQAPAQENAQEKVTIRVEAASHLGELPPVWAFFSYDEPNYSYMPDGLKLLGELAALGPAPVYMRAHNLLNTGDGTPAPGWGSTNVYIKAPAGYPIYNWPIGDRIFDAWHNAKLQALAEIGYMPEALSTHPEPYRGSPKGVAGGWAYPPKDYQEWGELVYRWVLHKVERYGPDDLRPWLWTVWNEPDTANWQGTPEEFYKLYDFAADAARRAFPDARLGGPFCSGPANPKAAAFLRGFLEHCLRGKNYATGKTGAPLDYIGFDRQTLADVARGFEIVASFPELRAKPVIIGAQERAGALGPSHTAVQLDAILDLARAREVRLTGVFTRAFKFEDRPWFADSLNLYRMLGMMSGQRLKAESSRGPDIGVLASGGQRRAFVLLWNDHAGDGPAPDAAIELTLAGLPESAPRIEVHHYRIDAEHSNAHAAWKKMGAPAKPSAAQIAELEKAGKLQLLGYPLRIPKTGAEATLKFALPRQAVSLVEITW